MWRHILFLAVLWVGLQYVIMTFPSQTHLNFGILFFIQNRGYAIELC